MTCQRLRGRGWSLWVRVVPSHWTYVLSGKLPDVELALSNRRSEWPDGETLVLPPGEHPIESRDKCLRGQ